MHSAKSNLPKRFALLLATIPIWGLILTTGCASRSAYVVARQNVQYQLGVTNKIAIADHAHPRPEEQSLRTALLVELRQQGFHVVASDEAEYTLTYWIDVSWKRGKLVVSDRKGTWSNPNTDPGVNVPPHFRTTDETSLSIQHVVDVPYETKGIRLKVFPQKSMRAGNLQTAWDGYIEGGDEVSERREPILLRTLLNYFGKDFVGRAKLVAAPPSDEK